MPPVRTGDVPVREDGPHAPARDHPAGEDCHVVEAPGDRGEVVVHDDDESPRPRHLSQDLPQKRLGDRVDRGEGLVEHHRDGFLRDGAGEKHALLLSSGQLPDGPVPEPGQGDAAQGVPDPLAIPGARPPPQAPERVASHADHFRHRRGIAPVDVRALGNVGDAVAVTADRIAEQGDGAPIDRNQPQHRLDEGGFPGAVGADDGAHAPGVKGPAGIVENPPVAVGDPQAVDAKAARGRHRIQPSRRPSATALAFARIMPR